jgi:hypothetical protein
MLSKDHFTYIGRQLLQWNQDNIVIILLHKEGERNVFCTVYLVFSFAKAVLDAEIKTNILVTSRIFGWKLASLSEALMAAEPPKVNLPFFRCLGAYLLDNG